MAGRPYGPSLSSSLAMIFFHLTGLACAAPAGLAPTATTPSLRLALGSAPPAAALALPSAFSPASIFAFPTYALMNMPWNQRYNRPGVGAADGEGTRGGYSATSTATSSSSSTTTGGYTSGGGVREGPRTAWSMLTANL